MFVDKFAFCAIQKRERSRMGAMDDEMPRAKRLKMLREAKERKERLERGEQVDEVDAGVETLTIEKQEEDDANAQVEEVAGDDEDKSAESALTATQRKQQPEGEEDEDESELLNLAPKRANWDIERDIAPMLKKLEKRTQYSIVEILREWLLLSSLRGWLPLESLLMRGILLYRQHLSFVYVQEKNSLRSNRKRRRRTMRKMRKKMKRSREIGLNRTKSHHRI